MSVYQAIKKYILILSVFFALITGAHIIFVYLYNGSELIPEQWGTVNIGFIASPPSLNPALYGLDSTNDYILRFLSRSLLRYDVETKQMEWDLANCNLGKDFSEIKCYVKNDNKWSDGTPITKDDIFATYLLFKETDINKPIKNILANITIQDQGDYIQFSGKADILMLDIFLYPIIQRDVAEKIRNGTFALNSSLSSGPYVFEKRETEEKTGVEKISLIKNTNATLSGTYVEKYVYKFFRDSEMLLSNKDTLNIVYPTDKIDTIPSARFSTYNYLLPQYVALFLNSEKLATSLRTLLLSQIGNTKFASLDEKKGKIIRNPFFWEEGIAPKSVDPKEAEKIMKELGYFKKDTIGAELTKKMDESKLKVSLFNTFFTGPTNKKYFTTRESEILISGNVPADVTGVFINNYRLKTFVSGTHKFYFRASTTIGNLKDGANTYTLTFEEGGNKMTKESLTIYRALTQEEFDAKEKEFVVKNTVAATNTALEETKKAQEKKALTAKIASLDPAYYYNRDLKKMNIHLSYTNQSSSFDFVAVTKEISSALTSIGIETTTQELNTDDIQKIVSAGEKNYDVILTGINLGLFDYNIFPFFHSGQAEKGFNFSKIKNVTLDILLERLKSSQMNSESLKHIETEILTLLGKENVVFTLYSPYNSFFIDKSLKQVKTVNVIPYSSSIYDIGSSIYTREKRLVDFSKKGIFAFISWIRANSPVNLWL